MVLWLIDFICVTEIVLRVIENHLLQTKICLISEEISRLPPDTIILKYKSTK